MANLQRRLRKENKVRAKKASTRVDMTPLADLGFLLITFFMFTTTFSKPNVMGLNMPPKNPNQETPEETPVIDLTNSISIILGAENRIFWHQKDKTKLVVEDLHETSYTREGIRKEIINAKKRAKIPDNFTVIIKPNDDSTYENLVNVLDEMKITESSRYGIVDISPNEISVYEEKSGISNQ